MPVPTGETLIEALGDWRTKHIWLERLKIEEYNGEEDAPELEKAAYECDEAERWLVTLYRQATNYKPHVGHSCHSEHTDANTESG